MNLEFIQEIYGDPKGKALFTLTLIDNDDTEDTTVQFWRANDHDHLQELFIKDSTSEDDSEYDDMMVSQIEEDWGINILPLHIANFN